MSETRRHRRQAVLFTKNPVAGRVKTRLVGVLSEEQAAQLHGAFVHDIVSELLRGDFGLTIAWATAHGESPAEHMLPRPVEGFEQEGKNLGERLYNGLVYSMAESGAAVAIGSDHPTMGLDRVLSAFAALDSGASVCLGPAHDGGYYLIGARSDSLTPRLFERICWSTGAVLAQTIERCRECGLKTTQLEPVSDVDTPDDLDKLVSELRIDPSRAPKTAALLREWERL